jgi:hypothetical protein
MKESILHYIWQHKLFISHSLFTTDGEQVEVIDVGKLNSDAGPDFFNAKIKIGNTLWAGNVEIHTLASEWKRHNHQNDKTYDSIILHVVKHADEEIFRADGEKIPQIELVYPALIEENYENLIKAQKWIPCEDKIGTVHGIFIQNWKTVLLTERLAEKTQDIVQLLNDTKQHWEEAFYIKLARSFGFSTNSQAFEQLAKSLPLNIIGKHKNNLFQLEAMLLGQSSLLNVEVKDEYILSLEKEYNFLKVKYDLHESSVSNWKLLRLRPDNFPHIRIAQFAALIHNSSKLFSRIIENPDINYLVELFKTEPSEYWKTHYTFGHTSPEKSKKLGKNSINSILINTVVPFIFCYALQKGNQDLKDKALQLFAEIPVEQNVVIKGWQNIGIKAENAFDSQALLQLKKHYCDDKKCLHCRIGLKVLTV